ncbi:MAG TPA: 30S ribosomal protein S6 [Syntrophorhabdaceae bacterium]|nr:30S ribosomal protein S6 [Syntrophorhabdaceae bacterium]MDI9560971.1 30S ribosomal protein S6 [Pseudomonadota bacterium]OQC48615.1 MAG: 30S ribosomal protein S6 [Deltaproteobacteria bacterium ADurb.Bin026]MBP8697646.1 30S ribosomal protein S6 [Syntrophorhabdaceae bacterium]MBV6505421.1 30S ribosomal protein S6 [Syntrophorhabdaceae bacterium]
MGRYENILILSPDCTKGEEEDLLNRIRANFAKTGATIIKEDDWSIRRLAYPIRKKDKGHYFFFLLDMDEAGLGAIGKFYKNIDFILRHMMVRVDDNEKGPDKAPDHVLFDELESEFS